MPRNGEFSGIILEIKKEHQKPVKAPDALFYCSLKNPLAR